MPPRSRRLNQPPGQSNSQRRQRPSGPRKTKLSQPSPAFRPAAANHRDDVLEGRNPVLEALKAGRPLNRILLSEAAGRPPTIVEITRVARQNRVIIERVDRRSIDRLSPTGRSQGVIAITAAKPYTNLDRLLEIAQERREPPLIVILDKLEDPQNLGAIIRTTEASGAHGVVIPERRAASLTAAVSRSSAGAIEYVSVARVGNLSRAMSHLGEQGLWTVGVDPNGKQAYTDIDYTQPTAIVIGAEGKGLSRLVRERCDLLASIPMRGKVQSLNASVAAALVLFEAVRQRG